MRKLVKTRNNSAHGTFSQSAACCLLFLLLTACQAIPQEGITVDVMTYNIKVAYGDPGPNKWENRKEALADLVQYYAPDILGLQEALERQLKDISHVNQGYSYTGVGRDDGKTTGEYCAIFYRQDRFELVRGGTFWLSETPSVPSKGWDANYYRICTYALLKEIGTEHNIWVFNTHWDHQSTTSRKMSARLIVDSIAARVSEVDAPVLLMGDFNAVYDSEPIQTIVSKLDDAKGLCTTKPYGPVGTFTGFDTSLIASRRIDFIFTGDGASVSRYRVIDDRMPLAYPSDHFPVLVSIQLPVK